MTNRSATDKTYTSFTSQGVISQNRQTNYDQNQDQADNNDDDDDDNDDEEEYEQEEEEDDDDDNDEQEVEDQDEEQENNDNIISEKDEDLEDMSCSQFIKQTEFSLNKEDMHSTSRFDSEYIHNALNEGLNSSSSNNSKGIERDEEWDMEMNAYDTNNNQVEYGNNYTSYSKLMAGQSIDNKDIHSLNISIFNQQHNDYINQINQLKTAHYQLYQENTRLKQEIDTIQQQNQTHSHLIRMKTEYQQIQYNEKINLALQHQKEKYEGKIMNYREQIKMYQTTIENIRTQYKEKNQKLYDIVLKLEKEKQELMDKNISLIKNKIQTKLTEENNLNNSQNLCSSLKLNQNVVNATSFNSNSQLNNTLNFVNESFDNLNFTGSFSKQLASMKQNTNQQCNNNNNNNQLTNSVNQSQNQLEKLQGLKLDQICIQKNNDQLDQSYQQEYHQSLNNTLRIAQSSQQVSSSDINKEQPKQIKNQIINSFNSKQSDQNINNQSSNNPFQFTRLTKQIKIMEQDDKLNASFSRDYSNQLIFNEDQFYKDKINNSLLQGGSLLHQNNNNNTYNNMNNSYSYTAKQSQQESPLSNKNHNQFSKTIQEKRSYSIDSNVLRDLNKENGYMQRGQNDQRYDSCLSRVKQYQDYLLNDNEILRKRNSIVGQSRKNSFSESADGTVSKNLRNQQLLKNNFMKAQTTITVQSTGSSDQNKIIKTNNHQRNSASFSQTHSQFNKENSQININTNKSSYMKQTQSSKQKKAIYKPPEYLASSLPSKSNLNPNKGSDKKIKKKSLACTTQTKKLQIQNNKAKSNF